jgi:hypothetical protein
MDEKARAKNAYLTLAGARAAHPAEIFVVRNPKATV